MKDNKYQPYHKNPIEICEDAIQMFVSAIEYMSETSDDPYVIDGEEYQSELDFNQSQFLDFGHHRCHGDINVIQFLTHYGGPAGGFWLYPSGKMTYWTAWWGAPHMVEVRNSDKQILLNFFEVWLEGASYEYDGYEASETGLGGAMQILEHVERLKEMEIT